YVNYPGYYRSRLHFPIQGMRSRCLWRLNTAGSARMRSIIQFGYRSVHLFPHRNHTIAQFVSNISPATVVLDSGPTSSVPTDNRGIKSGEFRIRRGGTVGLGQKNGAVKVGVPTAGFRYCSLTNYQ